MTRKEFNTSQGRFGFLCIPLSRSGLIFPAPAFTYAFDFPEAAFGRGCVRAAVGTRQKPKMMRPTSCQVLLVRINHRAGDYGARSGPRWLRGRVFCSRPEEATGAGEPAPSPDSAFRSAFVPRGADLQGYRLRPPGPPLHSPARPRRRPPPPKSTALDSLPQRPGSRTPGPSRLRQNSSAMY